MASVPDVVLCDIDLPFPTSTATRWRAACVTRNERHTSASSRSPATVTTEPESNRARPRSTEHLVKPLTGSALTEALRTKNRAEVPSRSVSWG